MIACLFMQAASKQEPIQDLFQGLSGRYRNRRWGYREIFGTKIIDGEIGVSIRIDINKEWMTTNLSSEELRNNS